jgi:capsular polysaccharide biosynthesis protein
MRAQEQGLPAAVLHVLDVSSDYAGRRAVLAKPWQAALLGAVIGLMLAMTYALVASLLDRTLRWPDEVEQQIGVHVVGRIRKAGDRIVA